jgi:hypothetical protein
VQFIYDDGGRAAAGFKGKCGDCVTRSIAIATGKPYADVYRELRAAVGEYASARRTREARRIKRRGVSVRDGVAREIYEPYLLSLGWRWVPTMQIGQGCRVHLVDGELPMGRIIVRLSGHLAAVIDGAIHDTYDPRRATIICEDGIQRITHRCVYGYFQSI